MNYKLEKFWNKNSLNFSLISTSWTINLKSFEILIFLPLESVYFPMNYKLEKFWNVTTNSILNLLKKMNYKLEKFWNMIDKVELDMPNFMNYKLEKFWNGL